jgi:hypothetical protein
MGVSTEIASGVTPRVISIFLNAGWVKAGDF